MRKILASLLGLLLLSSGLQADSPRARFVAIQAQEAHNAEAAFGAMVALADAGFAPAASRVGYYYRHGVGTQSDLTMARRWYQRATAEGHPWAFASLARVELALGQADAALQLLQDAARDRRPNAARLLGTAHIDRAFGTASDPALGHRILKTLAREGDANAARDLVLRHNWARLQGQIPDPIVIQLVQIGLAGDAKFAEAALVYLSRQGGGHRSVLEQRRALMQVPGIRHRTLQTERVKLAAAIQPGRFWIATETILQGTDPAHYAHVARHAFWINKNAWVRVLQKELHALGYYSGRIDAKMTAPTIRAQNRFCREMDIWKTCATGPLRGKTVYAVADALASVRDRQ